MTIGGGAPEYRAAMAMNQKPEVDVPSDQPPSYQLEIEDIEVGDGEEARDLALDHDEHHRLAPVDRRLARRGVRGAATCGGV